MTPQSILAALAYLTRRQGLSPAQVNRILLDTIEELNQRPSN